MNSSLFDNIYKSTLSDSEFKTLSEFIQKNYGIKMPPTKRIVLQGRLHKRLKHLQISDFKTYIDYVFSKDGENEIIHMMDVVSTNKTDFYREPLHFDFLRETLLPEYMKTSGRKHFKIWSAGCSSGEEPYTIGIVLQEFKDKNHGFDFSILATDISTKVLQHGANGIYKEERIAPVPLELKRKYFLRSKNKTDQKVRVVKQLRSKISFMRLNFMDNSYSSINETFDVIFCRNALIYFERDVQEKVISKLCEKLTPNGFFLLGHSESITNMNVPLKSIKPTIFRKI